jgi:hypothetical protein
MAYAMNIGVIVGYLTPLLRTAFHLPPPWLFLNFWKTRLVYPQLFNMFPYDSSMINALYYVAYRDTIE